MSKYFRYGGLVCRKKDIQKEAKKFRFNPEFSTREQVSPEQAKQKDRMGIWCHNCNMITVQRLQGRNQNSEHSFKCTRCDRTRTLKM